MLRLGYANLYLIPFPVAQMKGVTQEENLIIVSFSVSHWLSFQRHIVLYNVLNIATHAETF